MALDRPMDRRERAEAYAPALLSVAPAPQPVGTGARRIGTNGGFLTSSGIRLRFREFSRPAMKKTGSRGRSNREKRCLSVSAPTPSLSHSSKIETVAETALIGYQIQHRTGETLARYLPKLDAKTMKDLRHGSFRGPLG